MTRRFSQVGSSLRACSILLVALTAPGSSLAATDGKPDAEKPITAEAVDAATFSPPPKGEPAERKTGREDRPDPMVVKAQILLDRAHFYPGAIDGLRGDNYERALSAFAVAHGLPATKRLTPEVWDRLRTASDGPVMRDYTITAADAAGPYVARIPRGMQKQADLKSLGYTSPREMLAERFHMSRALLSALNPGKPLDRAGTVIAVAAVDPMGTDKPESKDLPFAPKVERIVVDKKSRDVRAFGADGKLLDYFPASIGSTEKPAPSGDTRVLGVAFDPTYTYNPKYRFKGVTARHKFTIRPGPNNPVGLVWIDLAIPSYGIHGTPEPENIGKTESHGCIRLTNWNARDLAEHVARGAKVAFEND